MDLSSLAYLISRKDMIEVYKYIHGYYTVNDDIIKVDEDITRRWHSDKLKKNYCRASIRKQFFSFRIVNAWNGLSEDVVSSPSVNSFKSRLDKVWKQFRFMDVDTEIEKEILDNDVYGELLNDED